MSKTKTLELAMAKAASLPDAAQEQIGREVLERIDTLTELREQLAVGIRELDAGRGEELDIDDVIKKARAIDAKGGDPPSRPLAWSLRVARVQRLADCWRAALRNQRRATD
jgi:hypothetical protein